MDSSAVAILITLILGICLLFFLGATLNPGEDEPKPTVYSDTSDKTSEIKSSSKTNTSDKPKADKLSESSQKTIYAFSVKTAKCICPFCDGENSTDAKENLRAKYSFTENQPNHPI